MKNIEFQSAQNVNVEFELAGIGQRMVAILLDMVLFLVYFVICGLALNLDIIDPYYRYGTLSLLLVLLIKIPFIFYYPVVEYLTRGQSFGKYIMGIRVVTLSGERPGLREVFTRWIFRCDFLWLSTSAFLLFWFTIPILAIIFASTSSMRQRVGDAMANTIVIKNKSATRYTLKDVLSIKSQENYEPIYVNVTSFTDDDMLLIKKTIQRVQAYPNDENKKFAVDLANKTAKILGLEETPEKKFKFLKTVLHDYVVLTR